jgi:hypothetical protein
VTVRETNRHNNNRPDMVNVRLTILIIVMIGNILWMMKKKSRLEGGSSLNREASKGWDEDPLT